MLAVGLFRIAEVNQAALQRRFFIFLEVVGEGRRERHLDYFRPGKIRVINNCFKSRIGDDEARRRLSSSPVR